MPAGYVYILKNRAFSALKIGKTTKSPEERATELSGTGTPHPFEVVHSVFVDDCGATERKIHAHLSKRRVSKKREFFRVSVEEAIEAVDQFAGATGPSKRQLKRPLSTEERLGLSTARTPTRQPVKPSRPLSTEERLGLSTAKKSGHRVW